MKLGIHPLHSSVQLPTYGTDDAACFDIRACFGNNSKCMAYSSYSVREDNIIGHYSEDASKPRTLVVYPNQRVLVPTGIIFEIPKGKSLRLHMRSGIALKRGLMLANGEGVIDSDYTHETFVMLVNTSETACFIEDGERICQGELVDVETATISFVEEAPTTESNRLGGFGSTGTS